MSWGGFAGPAVSQPTPCRDAEHRGDAVGCKAACASSRHGRISWQSQDRGRGGQSDAVLRLFLSQLKLDEIAISLGFGVVFFLHVLQFLGANIISSSSICSPLGN